MDTPLSSWTLVHVRSTVVYLTDWQKLGPPARCVLAAAGTAGFHQRLLAARRNVRATVHVFRMRWVDPMLVG